MMGNQSERAVKKLREAKRNLIDNNAPTEGIGNGRSDCRGHEAIQ